MMRRVLPKPTSAALAFLLFSLNFHSNTPRMRVPARRQSSCSRSMSGASSSGLNLKKIGSSSTGARLAMRIKKAIKISPEMSHQSSGRRRSVP